MKYSKNYGFGNFLISTLYDYFNLWFSLILARDIFNFPKLVQGVS